MSYHDPDYPFPQEMSPVSDAHQVESDKHQPRENGRRLRRVVYVYDDDSGDDVPQAQSVSRGSAVEPVFAGQEMDPTFFPSVNNKGLDEPQPMSRRSELVQQCSHCSACCQQKLAVSPSNPRVGSATALYLYAFGVTTVMYSVHTAGISPVNMASVGLAMFYGGLTQFVCGFFELVNKNTLGGTTAASYGAFWMAHAYMYNAAVEENSVLGLTRGAPTDYLGGYAFVWFFFTVSLLCCHFTSETSPFLVKVLLFLLALDFLLQAIGEFAGAPAVVRAAGYDGLVVGSLAIYIASGLLMHETYGRSVLPLFFTKGWRLVAL